MTTSNCGWHWVEVSAQDLAGQTFESLTAQYRGEKPVGLLTPLQNLNGYTVLNIFAPLHAAFWAAPGYSGFLRKCYEALNHLYDDQVGRNLFMKDLRQAKIRKADPQIRLFNQYAEIFQVSGKSVPSLSGDAMKYSEAWRFKSVGFANKHRNHVIEYLEQELSEFGKYSFFRIDESILLADPRGCSSVGSYLFHNIDYRFHGEQLERTYFKQEVLRELKWVVSRLEGGLGFDTPIEPIWMIKGAVGFNLFPAMLQNPPEFEDPVAREILSYRARLVHLLGWPHQYQSVLTSLNAFSQQKGEMSLGVFEPYDVESELRAYLDEMRQRYPVLEQDMFKCLTYGLK